MSPTALAATYSLSAIVLAAVLVTALHVLEPEFDPSWRMLSEYSLGRYGLLMRVAFIAAGSSVIVTAVALSGAAGPWSIALGIVAVGPLVAAFVDTDPITTPPAQMSLRSKVHAAFGMLFIFGFPVAATAIGISASGAGSFGPILGVASILPWIALAWFMTRTIRHPRTDAIGAAEIPIGWPNRVSMVAYLGWVALAAALLIA